MAAGLAVTLTARVLATPARAWPCGPGPRARSPGLARPGGPGPGPGDSRVAVTCMTVTPASGVARLSITVARQCLRPRPARQSVSGQPAGHYLASESGTSPGGGGTEPEVQPEHWQ
jgi:hypothetical protein